MLKAGLIVKMDIELKCKNHQINTFIIIMDMEDQEFLCLMVPHYKYFKFSSILLLNLTNKTSV
jgi:hypothetical protein